MCAVLHIGAVVFLLLKGTPWGLEYTFLSALFVTTRPIHILVFDTYMPRYLYNCLRCSLIAFSASWSRSMCKFQQFLFEISGSQGVPLRSGPDALSIFAHVLGSQICVPGPFFCPTSSVYFF